MPAAAYLSAQNFKNALPFVMFEWWGISVFLLLAPKGV